MFNPSTREAEGVQGHGLQSEPQDSQGATQRNPVSRRKTENPKTEQNIKSGAA